MRIVVVVVADEDLETVKRITRTKGALGTSFADVSSLDDGDGAPILDAAADAVFRAKASR